MHHRGPEDQAETRSNINQVVRRDIIMNLEEILHANNGYIRSFRAAIEKITAAEFRVVINANKSLQVNMLGDSV